MECIINVSFISLLISACGSSSENNYVDQKDNNNIYDTKDDQEEILKLGESGIIKEP